MGMRAIREKTGKKLTALFLSLLMLPGLLPIKAVAEEKAQKEEIQKVRGAVLTEVDDSFAEDKWRLIFNYPQFFHRLTYQDEKTGLYLHYSLYFPEKYNPEEAYPLVIFIADESTTGNDLELPVAQGRGAVVWAAEEWQKIFPCIVAVPVYRERILDNTLYTTTSYVSLTGNWVKSLCAEYPIDETRIYGTGQGMGCEILMVLASRNPKLFAASMFVSGQWDAKRLRGLEKQKFILFAAEEDTPVRKFSNDLMAIFDTDGVGYAHTEWDGTWTPSQLSTAGVTLTTSSTGHYFVAWKRGTIIPDSDLMHRLGTNGTRRDAIHRASFDEAYRCVAIMEWMFAQTTAEAETQ